MPPHRRLTLRALAAAIALFALDFGGIAWVIRTRPHGPRVGNTILRAGVWERVNPLRELLAPVVFLGPVVLLSVLIYLYLPRRLGEILTVILILVVLVLLLVPVLRH